MSFDEISFPLKAGYGASGGPQFSTEVTAVAGGYEKRNQNWSQARRKFDAGTGVFSREDAAAIIAFFHARRGRARGFRLKDWNDYSSAADGYSAPRFDDQTLGVGDGVKSVFQLVKKYGGAGAEHERIITKPVSGSVKAGVNGVEAESGFSVNCANGLVTFASPPAEGVSITAGFLFDVPVRFDCDALSISLEDAGRGRCEIPIVEIRV